MDTLYVYVTPNENYSKPLAILESLTVPGELVRAETDWDNGGLTALVAVIESMNPEVANSLLACECVSSIKWG